MDKREEAAATKALTLQTSERDLPEVTLAVIGGRTLGCTNKSPEQQFVGNDKERPSYKQASILVSRTRPAHQY